MDINLQLNTKNLLKAYHLFPRELAVELKDGLDHASKKFLKEFRKRQLRGGPEKIYSRPGPQGLFAQFKRNKIAGAGLDLAVEVETSSPVAGIHERGGDRTGRGRIAVPLSFAPIFTNGKNRRVRKQYRDVLGLVRSRKIFRKEINGQMYLCNSETGQPYFVLKNKVRVQPRLKFGETFSTLAPEFSKIYNRSFDRALKKGGW
jgi:hypothetical protein